MPVDNVFQCLPVRDFDFLSHIADCPTRRSGNVTGVGLQLLKNELKKCRFTNAITTGHRHSLTGVDNKIQIFKQQFIATIELQTFGTQHQKIQGVDWRML